MLRNFALVSLLSLALVSTPCRSAENVAPPLVQSTPIADQSLPSSASFSWAGGIEDTFIPQTKGNLRALEEYELTQHYAQWREDIDRAASLGITKLRWGVPWYRVEPQHGHFEWTFVDQVLPYMQSKHVEPIVDLVHYGTPLWMSDSFSDPHYPQYVAEYAQAFAERYGKSVRYYTPLNEPAVNAEFCGLKGLWPPYLNHEKGYVSVLIQLVRGMQATVKAIRATDSDAVIVAVEPMRHVVAGDDTALALHEFYRDLLAFDLVRGKVDSIHPLYSWLMERGVTAADLDAIKAGAVDEDVLGVNYYPWSSLKMRSEGGKVTSEQGDEHGRLLLDVIRNCYDHTHKPIFVTETSAPGNIDHRQLWMSETVDAVRAARSQGIPVIGYTWFPIFSMINWDYRTEQKPISEYVLDLGLWDARFDAEGTFVRKATPMVDSYKDWVRRGMTPVCGHPDL